MKRHAKTNLQCYKYIEKLNPGTEKTFSAGTEQHYHKILHALKEGSLRNLELVMNECRENKLSKLSKAHLNLSRFTALATGSGAALAKAREANERRRFEVLPCFIPV
jgi:hypothetical protein